MLDRSANERFYQMFSQELRAAEWDSSNPVGLAVYRNNSRAAYLRVLQETFPVVEKLVGAEFFRYLANEYYHCHPAAAPWVRNYGTQLPEFLVGFEPASHLPYLPDVAHLEILWLESYHASDATSLTPQDLQNLLGGEDSVSRRLALHPSLRLLSSTHPVATLWKHNRKSDGPLTLTHMKEHIIVARPELEVEVSVVKPEIFLAIRELSRGATIEQAIEKIATGDPTILLSEVLRTLLECRLVIQGKQTS